MVWVDKVSVGGVLSEGVSGVSGVLIGVVSLLSDPQPDIHRVPIKSNMQFLWFRNAGNEVSLIRFLLNKIATVKL